MASWACAAARLAFAIATPTCALLGSAVASTWPLVTVWPTVTGTVSTFQVVAVVAEDVVVVDALEMTSGSAPKLSP